MIKKILSILLSASLVWASAGPTTLWAGGQAASVPPALVSINSALNALPAGLQSRALNYLIHDGDDLQGLISAAQRVPPGPLGQPIDLARIDGAKNLINGLEDPQSPGGASAAQKLRSLAMVMGHFSALGADEQLRLNQAAGLLHARLPLPDQQKLDEKLLAWSRILGRFQEAPQAAAATRPLERASSPVPLAPYASHFDQEREFPKYFLPKEHRGSPAAEIPSDVVRQQAGLLAKAVASILRRVTLPVVPAGSSDAVMVRYFEYISPILKGQAAAELEIMASGGVVRTAIGYLYHLIHQRAVSDPEVSAEKVLREVLADTRDLSGLHVRGVGSDWDMLLRLPAELGAGKDALMGKLQAAALGVANSAEQNYGMREEEGAVKRGIFAVGDVKDYDQQTARSSGQGGSTIDLLAFDVAAGQFIEAPDHPGVVEDLVRGLASYVGPQTASSVEDSAKQTIRGLRLFLELPFLSFQDESLLREELSQMIKTVQEGGYMSSKARGQFDKMVRNARYGGAHNRFYRALPGSIESLVLTLVDKLRERENRVLVPEFVDHFPLEGRDGSELNGLPERLVQHGLPWARFYHGTASAENGLAIMRGGLFISKDAQGTAAHGRGAYSSQDLAVAQGYAGEHGVVFELGLKSDRRINILDWPAHQNDPEILAIAAKAEAAGRNVFEYLAREHGIDIILNTHILIENAEAVQFPAGFGGLIRTYAHAAQDRTKDLDLRLNAFEQYQNLYRYGLALKEPDLPALATGSDSLIEDLARALPAEKNLEKRLHYYQWYSRLYAGNPAMKQSGLPTPETLVVPMAQDWVHAAKDKTSSMRERLGKYETYLKLYQESPVLKQAGLASPDKVLIKLAADCAHAALAERYAFKDFAEYRSLYEADGHEAILKKTRLPSPKKVLIEIATSYLRQVQNKKRSLGDRRCNYKWYADAYQYGYGMDLASTGLPAPDKLILSLAREYVALIQDQGAHLNERFHAEHEYRDLYRENKVVMRASPAPDALLVPLAQDHLRVAQNESEPLDARNFAWYGYRNLYEQEDSVLKIAGLPTPEKALVPLVKAYAQVILNGGIDLEERLEAYEKYEDLYDRAERGELPASGQVTASLAEDLARFVLDKKNHLGARIGYGEKYFDLYKYHRALMREHIKSVLEPVLLPLAKDLVQALKDKSIDEHDRRHYHEKYTKLYWDVLRDCGLPSPDDLNVDLG